MVNRKGIIRIIEASIAVLIILTAIISVSLTKKAIVEKDLSGTINPLLEEIAKNSTLREEIIMNNGNSTEKILNFLSRRIREPSIGFDAKVCEINDACSLNRYPSNITGDVYAGSRLISSGLIGGEQPKRVSIFLWIKA